MELKAGRREPVVIAQAINIPGHPDVELAKVAAGFIIDGETTRWMEEHWSVRWADGSGEYVERRFARSDEGTGAAHEYYLGLIRGKEAGE